MFEASAVLLPLIRAHLPVPPKPPEQTTVSRCADQVSAMVEKLNEARKASSWQLPGQAGKAGPVKDYGKVLNKLYEERTRLPQSSALFILKTG